MGQVNEKREFEFYSNIRSKKVEWLWYPYIPYGKITILQGDPGEGKSTLLLNLAALLSVGGTLPTGESIKEPCNIIYQCAEDSLADTIKPRLITAGADCSKIAFIVDNDASLTLDDLRIERTIRQTKARMVVIDPIQAYIPPDADMLSATKMRTVLRKLANVAEEQNCAVVLVGHMNKGVVGKNLYRGLGSIDIVAIARSVLMISRDEEDPYTRYLFPVKSSLAPEGEAVGFRLGTEHGFQWLGKCEYDRSALEALLDEKKSKKELAQKYIEELLSEGDKQSAVIFQKISSLGISERTVNAARSEMDIRVYRQGGKWFWHLNSVSQRVEVHPL